MSRTIKNSAGTTIDEIRLLYVRTAPEVANYNNRTLGGLWFFQTIGTAAIKAEVELLARGSDARDNVLDFYANGDEIVVEFDGLIRTGYILEKPAAEIVKPGIPTDRVYKITFSLGVNSEVSA